MASCPIHKYSSLARKWEGLGIYSHGLQLGPVRSQQFHSGIVFFYSFFFFSVFIGLNEWADVKVLDLCRHVVSIHATLALERKWSSPVITHSNTRLVSTSQGCKVSGIFLNWCSLNPNTSPASLTPTNKTQEVSLTFPQNRLSQNQSKGVIYWLKNKNSQPALSEK